MRSPGEALEADCVRARQQLGNVLLSIKHACNWDICVSLAGHLVK